MPEGSSILKWIISKNIPMFGVKICPRTEQAICSSAVHEPHPTPTSTTDCRAGTLLHVCWSHSDHICAISSISDSSFLGLLLKWTARKDKIKRHRAVLSFKNGFQNPPLFSCITFGMSEHPTIFQQLHNPLFYSLLEVLLLCFQSLKFTPQTQPITMLKITASIWLH